jgi:hypothetical protein
MARGLRKPWIVADELDLFVKRHEGLLEETSAYEAWADAHNSPREAQEAKRDWFERHRRVLEAKNQLKAELEESIGAHQRSQLASGAMNHPLETNTDEKFPEELVYLDPALSDPSHYFAIADKERALINRLKNDEMAKYREKKKPRRGR